MKKQNILAASFALSISLSAIASDGPSNRVDPSLFVTGASQGVTSEMINARDTEARQALASKERKASTSALAALSSPSSEGSNRVDSALFVTGGSQGISQEMINSRDLANASSIASKAFLAENARLVGLFTAASAQGVTQAMINKRDTSSPAD